MSDGASPPYRSGLATSAGVVLLAALVLAVADVVHAGGAPLPVLALWCVLALPLAAGAGVVLGAGNATWGAGWLRGLLRRLREDAALDRAVAAGMLSAAVLAAVLVAMIGKLAVPLVGEVQRKALGALLLGGVVVAALPVLAVAAIPLHRVTRRIAAVIPAIGPVSRVVLLVTAAAVTLTASLAFVVVTRLDYKALGLSSLLVPALLPVVAIAIAALAFGPLSALRERLPRRGALALAGVALALVLPVLGLRGTPSRDTLAAVVDRSYVGPRLLPVLRALRDADHDGYSALFGGPDCDDGRPATNPGALDVPDNGIDENCDGFDSKKPAAPTAGPAAPAPPERTTLAGGDNVLIIFVDTLRADRMGYAGYRRDGASLTPRIDALAAQSVVFERAYANASNTPRSVPSFLSSLYPTQVKVDDPQRAYPRVADDNELLFETLARAGFTTLGMSSHFYFCDRQTYPDTCENVNYGSTPMATNATQGASLWDNSGALVIYDKNAPNSNSDVAGPRIVEKTRRKLDELAAGKQRFAMLVHLFEPHSTYVAHDGLTPPGAGFAAKYDYEIAFEDRMIGQLLDHLDQTGLAAKTTVILLSDHGEAFGVHTFAGEKQNYHGMTLYDEVLHVPLIIRVPGATPRKVASVVQLVDVAPTVAALFGVAAPARWVGRSLVPALEGRELTPMPAYAEMPRTKSWAHEARSMVSADGRYHVFHRVSDALWEVYDLTRDPEERANVVDSDPNARQLQQQLSSWASSLAPGGNR